MIKNTTTADVKISEIMSCNLKTLHPKDKLLRAKELFKEFDIHHILVHVMGDVRGIISLGDLIFLEGFVTNSFDEFLRTKKYEMATVDEIMTKRPHTAESDMLLSEVLELMIEKRVNAIPIKENDELVGIVTTYDIMKYFQSNLNNLTNDN